MRLQAIKLAGFKSFVDPTTVAFPSNLCAVVGPNGCGKSNIIDAVRWVMGESSAKTLRGESMADVIFNGSTTRKPIGQASIELIFDNTEGRLKGEYAGYSEISIKRQVSRDGTSLYLLNNQKCRRKDITDVFLGTGLGPRSYSIIEQGMISQLIEARPEDLRAYLEEAAGISKYKERRRETERRISHTRDNLDRLGDLCEELERQLHRLERQAKAAERYGVLKAEERGTSSQLEALRWQDIDAIVSSHDDEISRLTNGMEAETAEQRRIEADAVAEREALVDRTETVNEVQKRYYDLGTEIARLEETLQFQRERGRQLDNNLTELNASWESVRRDLEGDRARQTALQESLSGARERLEAADVAAREGVDRLIRAEAEMRDWQGRFERFSIGSAEPQKRAEAARARIEQLEGALQRQRVRLESLTAEHARAEADTSAAQLAPLREKLTGLEAESVEISARVAELTESIERQRGLNQETGERLDDLKSDLQSAQGRLASLDALQQAALGQEETEAGAWLESRGLADAARLGAVLQVAAPWEDAVETVLGDAIGAVVVNDADDLAAALDGAGVSMTLVGDTPIAQGGADDWLRSHVSGEASVAGLLAGIRCAPDVPAAIAMRAGLADGESVITPGGVWLGSDWLRVRQGEGAEAGVLRRQRDIEMLRGDIAELEESVYACNDALNTGVAELKSLEIERDHVGVLLAEKQREAADARAAVGAQEVQVAQVENELQRTAAEMEAGQAEMGRDTDAVNRSRAELSESLDLMERDSQAGERLQAERESLAAALSGAREAADTGRGEAHRVALEVRSIESDLASVAQAMERLVAQESTIREQHATLAEAIAENAEPIDSLQDSLTEQLAGRHSVEVELGEARRSADAGEAKIRQLEAARAEAEQRVETVRGSLEKVRLEREAANVRRTTISDRLAGDGFDVRQVLESIEEGASEAAWEERLTRVGNRITRLGPINLAAIDEFREGAERKEYLDAQNDDLEKALGTLENAIRKIDAETRTRFKETFDKVNRQLQQLFPKLFGGGHAYLEMTGDDLLNTGVGLMARPPGKRNASISMLSGGEKALTAIALVFAIFSLNPAPFCLLDEVDAPLDDANVGRYSDMVKEMSRSVQFIYITHNKIAMEMAEQLMGVTMHEAGVSRLVTVDVEEAVAMAAV